MHGEPASRLQPEGVVLRPEDFDGPLGPGNPLDAALRTTREYLARMGEIQRHGEPYPLLIVRPDGAVAYSVARLAMKSWDEEFGYELVEQESLLEYPPADPQLRQELERAVRDARQRQAALAAAMPSQFLGGGGQGGFVATPTRGGFVTAGRRAAAEANGSGGWRWVAGRRRGHRGARLAAGRRQRRLARAADAAGRLLGEPRRSTAPPGEGRHRQGRNGPERAGGPNGSCQPLADSRGKNWALPKANAQATGITRPIYIACLRDQLVILPEKGEPAGSPR